MKKAITIVSLVALFVAACGKGVDSPTGPSQTASANGSGNCVAVGNNNTLNCQPAASPTGTPGGTPSTKICEVAYVRMDGPEVLPSGETRGYSITPMNVDSTGKITEVPADCNIPRGPRVRWTVSGANAQITGNNGCDPVPGEPVPVVCGFEANVKRVAAGQFSITAVVPSAGPADESRGVTRYIN